MSNVLRIALVLAAAATLSAQHGVEGLSNPYSSPLDVEAGAVTYRQRCAVCHGPEGAGGKGTDLTRGRFRHGASDTELFQTIADGLPGTEMPGVELDGREMWRLVAYVRSLSEGLAAQQATGDPASGEELFFGAGNCANCHRVGMRGSRRGPDLSAVGAVRSLAQLESSILRPGDQVLPQHWSVQAVTKDGTEFHGLRLNEDSQSIQAIGANGKLTSLLKSELREYSVVKTSAMPSFEDRLTSSQVNDLVAYLARLGS